MASDQPIKINNSYLKDLNLTHVGSSFNLTFKSIEIENKSFSSAGH